MLQTWTSVQSAISQSVRSSFSTIFHPVPKRVLTHLDKLSTVAKNGNEHSLVPKVFVHDDGARLKLELLSNFALLALFENGVAGHLELPHGFNEALAGVSHQQTWLMPTGFYYRHYRHICQYGTTLSIFY